MFRFLIRIVLIGIVLSATTTLAYGETGITLQLNGQTVQTDVAPIIEDGRTLVPYRALLEAMGGEVSWDQEAGMATASLGNRKVQVTIDSTTGFVNGAMKEMDVPPRIANNRTLIPLRFVLENLNCTVNWDNITRTVVVTSPEHVPLTTIQRIRVEKLPGVYRVVAEGEDLIAGINTFAYQEPERYGIDIDKASLPEGVGSILAKNEIFQKVRYSQLDATTVRIVVDLSVQMAGKVSFSDDRTEVYLDFEIPGEGQPENTTGSTNASVDLPDLDWRAGGKLVALDAGHGGKDPGAEGIANGVHAIWEKDLNLAIAKRVYELLQAAGVNVQLLRNTDDYLGLYARPEAANLMHADLLVSMHNNSGETPTSRGTEVLYYAKESEKDYAIKSKDLASTLVSALVEEIGFPDRGIHNRPQLAVLNKSLMPAVIIEGGFLSNPEDLSGMMTTDFIEHYAIGAAKGIILTLNASVQES